MTAQLYGYNSVIMIKDGKIVDTQSPGAEPNVTWSPANEASALLVEACFVGVPAHAEFTLKVATAEDDSFIVMGKRP